ncbi:MAG: DUF3842 family protein [Deltaproteobacteria bacterium]|nr:DUF3842 family protein [Deltaproteobacteria bacterium]
MEKRICVIDGQGGGIGATLIKYLSAALDENVSLVALGTNAVAVANMLKAGANRGASGENAICWGIQAAECIVGPIGILWANAMLGEITPKMAEAVASNPARKILLPLSQEPVEIVGQSREPLPHLVQKAVLMVKEVLKNV